ncbi:unnamed protein product [Didymodactylos carnosus]|uniref:Methyltransferase type 11 domain-containing protein n=1 Tax=Didymodactylos carnosus TaxID=1234261 RepID=A0A814VVH5_9BILA|nr:unnamed protein product [Didymodactylos carnosus]CAF3957711.1 unnamed protein product [Didymodactylos carnosus]
MENFIHQTAANGFQLGAEVYERGRPAYPDLVINLICATNPDLCQKTIVDLAAGTGKFTRMLVSAGAKLVTAIEPVESMRRKLYSIPNIAVLNGTAENIPLVDNSVDIVTVAQAFHWFNGVAALEEIYRVLKPDGKLYLLWNLRDDDTCPWLQDMTKIIDKWQPKDHPHFKTMKWLKVFEDNSLFSSFSYERFSHDQCVTLDILFNRILSSSFISILDDKKKQILLQEVKAFLEQNAQTKEKTKFFVPYMTHVYWCQRL